MQSILSTVSFHTLPHSSLSMMPMVMVMRRLITTRFHLNASTPHQFLSYTLPHTSSSTVPLVLRRLITTRLFPVRPLRTNFSSCTLPHNSSLMVPLVMRWQITTRLLVKVSATHQSVVNASQNSVIHASHCTPNTHTFSSIVPLVMRR